MKNLAPLLILIALLCSGCSNQAIVVGNLASMVVTVGLFYSTLKLGGGS